MIKDLPIRERPREKLLLEGVESLSDSELLAIILKNGKKDKSVSDIARDLIKKYDSIKNIANVGIGELKQVSGIGTVKALELVACFEIGRRMYNRQVFKIGGAKDVYELLYSKLSGKLQEEFYGVFLDNKKQVIATKMLFKGTYNQSNIYVRDIFREALKDNAIAIILVHNHPSGDVTPSREDIDFTKQMYHLGRVIGVEVIDHIIVGYNTYYSFYDHNWWDKYEKKK